MNYQKLLEQLRRHEGLRLTAYLCPVGYWTIGYGRNLETKGLSRAEQLALFGQTMAKDDYIAVLKKLEISEAQAEELLLADVTEVEQALGRYFVMSRIPPVRQAVLANMAFQMGVGGLLEFRKMLAALRSDHWDDAAEEMLNSQWALQTPKRAKELAEQMRTGEWA